MSTLFLNTASMICFALGSGMVFVLHVLEYPAYKLLKDSRKEILESAENLLLFKQTRDVLGFLLAAGIPQLKAGMLVAGTLFRRFCFFKAGISSLYADSWCYLELSLFPSRQGLPFPQLRDWPESLLLQKQQNSVMPLGRCYE